NALAKAEDIHHWIRVLCEELHGRMEQDKAANKRLARLLIVGHYSARKGHCTKSVPIEAIGSHYPPPERMASDIMKVASARLTISDSPILNLSVAATKFVEESNTLINTIEAFFQKVDRETYNAEMRENATTWRAINHNN